MQLEVGMILYFNLRGGGLCRTPIIRVTEKRAFIKSYNSEIAFDREQRDSSFIFARGSSGYDAVSYQIETPELVANIQRQNLERKVQTQLNDIKIISSEKLLQILAILDEKNGTE